MNYIPCVTWVKKGVAKPVPEKVQLSPEELKELIESTKDELGDLNLNEEIETDSDVTDEEVVEGASNDVEKEGSKRRKRKKGEKAKNIEQDENKDDEDDDEDADLIREYGMDDYDDDDATKGLPYDGIAGLTYYANNDEDPYITLKEEGDSDDEDFQIRPEDNLLICGRVKRDHSNMDVFIYNENDDDFFIHHDLLLPAFPLAMEWLDFDPGDEKPGNLVAVSSMEPVIGIWDLDLEDAIEPVIVLGEKQKKKKSSKKKKSGSPGHTDAVLDLSWNRNVRNVLGSCSADTTVALWDLTQEKVVKSIPHDDKVQTIDWHPFEAQTLASGSFDKTVRVFDCRTSDNDCKKWVIGEEVERVVWNWSSPFHLLASSDKGFIYLFDVRTDKTVFTLSAHSKGVTGLALSSRVPNLLVTGSDDRTIKVWDIQDNKPEMIVEKNFKLGGVQCLKCCPDAPYTFAAGCEKDVKVWDVRENKAVMERFKGRTAIGASTASSKSTTDSTATVEAMDDLSVNDNSSETKVSNPQPQSSQSSNQVKKKKNKPKKKKQKSGKW